MTDPRPMRGISRLNVVIAEWTRHRAHQAAQRLVWSHKPKGYAIIQRHLRRRRFIQNGRCAVDRVLTVREVKVLPERPSTKALLLAELSTLKAQSRSKEVGEKANANYETIDSLVNHAMV